MEVCCSMRASNNGVDLSGGGARAMKVRKTGCWVNRVCLCGEGVRGLESAEKTVSGRWNSICEGSEVCLGDQTAEMWRWAREETAKFGEMEWV